MNHFEGSKELTRKDLLKKNIQRYTDMSGKGSEVSTDRTVRVILHYFWNLLCCESSCCYYFRWWTSKITSNYLWLPSFLSLLSALTLSFSPFLFFFPSIFSFTPSSPSLPPSLPGLWDHAFNFLSPTRIHSIRQRLYGGRANDRILKISEFLDYETCGAVQREVRTYVLCYLFVWRKLVW